MATAKIDARFEWGWEDGDGTKCHVCGDPAWLKQLRAFMVIGTHATPNATEEIELSGPPADLENARDVLTGKMKLHIVLCSSCGEMLNDA